VTLSRDLAIRHAWRGAFVAAALNAVGMSADFVLARDIPKVSIYPFAMSALVGCKGEAAVDTDGHAASNIPAVR